MLAFYYFAIIVLLSGTGFAVAFYIYRKKRRKEVLMCPLNAKCDTVIESSYSKFFGIPVEALGMTYYALVGLFYILCLFVPSLHEHSLALAVLFLSTGALFFSGYLTLIQAIVLRDWCSWCLISAGLSALIFVFSLFSLLDPLTTLLASYHILFVIVHVVAFALGAGGALLADVFLYRFLRDLRISDYELSILMLFSQIVWFALGLIIISGLGLFLVDPSGYLSLPQFLTKLTIVGVIVVNGIVLNMWVTPRLTKVHFGKMDDQQSQYRRFRHIMFGLGSFSAVSWLSAITLGLLSSRGIQLPFSYPELLGLYIALLVIAVISSQFFEYYVSRQPAREGL